MYKVTYLARRREESGKFYPIQRKVPGGTGLQAMNAARNTLGQEGYETLHCLCVQLHETDITEQVKNDFVAKLERGL